MAYRFKSGETIAEGVRRIARKELAAGIAELSGKGSTDRDEAIHEARKSIKKVRSLLRFVEEDPGASFAVENARLRDAGRALSSYRDPSAIIGSFDDLIDHRGADLPRGRFASIREALVRRKAEAEGASNLEETMREAAQALTSTRANVSAWKLEARGFDAIAPSVKRSFRRGKRALRRAEREPCALNYHDLRRRAKDYWYEMRLLRPVWKKAMKGYERGLNEIETLLGDDHNLVVLREAIAGAPATFGEASTVELLLGLIDRREDEMRDEAISLARRAYAEKPGAFRTRMARLWEAWRAPPSRREESRDAERPATNH